MEEGVSTNAHSHNCPPVFIKYTLLLLAVMMITYWYFFRFLMIIIIIIIIIITTIIINIINFLVIVLLLSLFWNVLLKLIGKKSIIGGKMVKYTYI